MKFYEECAKKILAIRDDSEFKRDLNAIIELMNKTMNDDRLTDKGKNQFLVSYRNEFNKKVNGKSKEIRDVVKEFCDKYEMKAPDNGKQYVAEVANIIKIIDTCGYSITPDILNAAIEPIKDSATQVKMVIDILEAKQSLGTGSYNQEVNALIMEYNNFGGSVEGSFNDCVAYKNALDDIAKVLELESILDFRIDDHVIQDGRLYVNESNFFSVVDNTSYSVFALDGNMMKVGKMYDEIYPGNERYFDR